MAYTDNCNIVSVHVGSLNWLTDALCNSDCVGQILDKTPTAISAAACTQPTGSRRVWVYVSMYS